MPKRTQSICRPLFRKRYAHSLISIAVATALFAVAGCEQRDESVALYQNADDCRQANPDKSAQCTTAYQNALQDAARTAPKYANRDACVAEFGENQCQPVSAALTENTSQASASGSFWMPMMAGYMMGRLMGGGSGFAQQPLFSPRGTSGPLNGQYVDASGRSYGAATPGRTITVPPSALARKPTVTTTTRGGFGESVNRLQKTQYGAASANRTYGG